jgi:hypothetical protein
MLRWLARILIALLALLVVTLGYFVWRFHFVLVRNVPTSRAGPLSAQLPAGDKLRFFVIGDSGSGDSFQMAVAQAMERRCQEAGLDGIVHVGDIFYEVGVASVEDPQWQTKVEIPYGMPCLRDKPIYAVHGNHDLATNPNAQIEYGRTHARWVQPYRFYERRFGNLLQLVALDGWYPDWCGDPERCTLDFARRALERRDTVWRLAFAHYPLASGNAKRSLSWRSRVLRLMLCDADLDFYFAGHDHHLEHRVDPSCRPEIFVSGAGGGDLYPVKSFDPESRFLVSAHGFAELELDSRSATVRFFGSDSTLLYENRRASGR